MTKIVISCLFIICMATGCGGDYSDGDYSGDENDVVSPIYGPPVNDNNRNLTVADIAGIWRFNTEVYGLNDVVTAMDESYVVITPDGEYAEYDYKGDSREVEYGNGFENCYEERNVGIIEKLPDGGFKISFSSGVITFSVKTNFELQDDNLLAGVSIFDFDTTLATPASVTREDLLQMSCDK